MLRLATIDDLESLILLVHDLHEESRFSELEFSVEKVASLMSGCILDDDKLLVVVEEYGTVIGGIAGYVAEALTSCELVGGDFGVFVSPSHRGGITAARLIKYFLHWAKSSGAKVSQLGISTGVQVEETGRLYEMMGGVRYGSLYEFRGDE